MKTAVPLTHEFVEYIPGDLQDGTIYVSITFATAVHKCCCGCGNEVVTPISPTDWKLIFDGVSISLEPSIGNWGFACKSHYFITRNKVVWVPRWSREQIAAGRTHDRFMKEKYFETADHAPDYMAEEKLERSQVKKSFWRKVVEWLSR